ncbi:methyltransferase domain protein [Lactobacillus pasteurii DSM 23907 = CRBIP 24.76]|uniref:Methyltransferase domain protein n=1 Tax=Lactobacillus pasteurii DSM 23907 = CRBIP 24.76 TaxID=1423790 RepID=I7JY48_9LACO|nr:class I SAM-dependent methyltransferase [Lactobacillus pasteurii]KRK08101.1 methyltransferase domain protein [Lactobacillus pasteurii DSM 23907 = CRBIP 24.76]TDG76053.1 hypothetical protein C5L33_001611 [Lactobacillus pasteurii]CCI85225.1 Methyltransferase domain protein [Lactobacillus pasteurii DSM 23907 = CRBIP 24.76]
MTEEKNQMYYAANPNAAHDEHHISYNFANFTLQLTTDAGVFSKMRVDYGSSVLIKAMAEVDFPQVGILDVGTGYGPIGLTAAKLWPNQTVDMIGVNERGLALAQRNAAANKISNVNIYASDIYQNVDKKYGLILTNPPIRAGKKVVSEILAKAFEHLVPGGTLLVVIQKKQGEPSARKLMQEVYGNCEIVTRDKGYYILKSVKSEDE